MTTAEFQAAVLAALDHPHLRLMGVTRKDVETHTTWNRLGRAGRITIEGTELTIREHHDSTAPIDEATWYTVSVPKSRAVDPTRGIIILTTPDDE